MYKIGLTGGIGSGKTTVSKIFKEFNIPVFNSDSCAREAESVPEIKEGFKKLLGDDIYIDGVLDRPKMRSIVFVDKEILNEVNNIVGPYVRDRFDDFCIEHAKSPYVIMESAILFETHSSKNFDKIIAVTADTNIRINRVLRRDKTTHEEVTNKLNNQWSEENKIKLSDFIIFNNGEDLIDSINVLTKQVRTIDKAILYEVILDEFSLLKIKNECNIAVKLSKE